MKVKNNTDNKTKKRSRIIALLTRAEMEFLEKLSLDSLFSTGKKLTRVDIISAFVSAMMALDISAKDVKNKKQLIDKIVKAVKNGVDKRRYPRIKKTLIVNFRTLDSLSSHKISNTIDISLGGFKMDIANADNLPKINQVIEITLQNNQDSPITAIGKVIWLRKKQDQQGFEVGVMLTYVKNQDKERFMKYLSTTVGDV